MLLLIAEMQILKLVLLKWRYIFKKVPIFSITCKTIIISEDVFLIEFHFGVELYKLGESSDNNSEERQWLGKSPVFVKNTFGDQLLSNSRQQVNCESGSGGHEWVLLMILRQQQKMAEKSLTQKESDCMNYYQEFLIMELDFIIFAASF